MSTATAPRPTDTPPTPARRTVASLAAAHEVHPKVVLELIDALRRSTPGHLRTGQHGTIRPAGGSGCVLDFEVVEDYAAEVETYLRDHVAHLHLMPGEWTLTTTIDPDCTPENVIRWEPVGASALGGVVGLAEREGFRVVGRSRRDAFGVETVAVEVAR